MFDKSQLEYKSLRNLLKTGQPRLVIWVGAGLSVPAGIPTWGQLVHELGRRLESSVDSLAEDKRTAAIAAAEFALGRSDHLWLSMQMLRDAVGEPIFRRWIREELQGDSGEQIPNEYKLLWKLRPVGMVTSNLDRLAAHAYPQVFTNRRLPTEFVGSRAESHFHLLSSPHQWVAHIHGLLDDATTWIFAQDQLSILWNNASYRTFIEQVMLSHKVLFMGVSADDVSAGGHLLRLREMGCDFGAHYWFTHRGDTRALDFASRAGVSIIRYGNSGSGHGEVQDFLYDLVQYVPPEPVPNPISPSVSLEPDDEALPAPQDVNLQNLERLRIMLNRTAEQILSAGTQEAYENYAEFRRQYRRAIHAAWFVAIEPPDNMLLGHKIVRHIARGAFGDVYEAIGPTGDNIAIKIFREDQSSVEGMLGSFRRGVRAMQILSDKGIEGMVPYLSASEIPPMVTMELVNGSNLREARQRLIFEDWVQLLRIASELCGIVHLAHVEAEVLHRDIRPANIMLREPSVENGERRVAVLDFDLSLAQRCC